MNVSSQHNKKNTSPKTQSGQSDLNKLPKVVIEKTPSLKETLNKINKINDKDEDQNQQSQVDINQTEIDRESQKAIDVESLKEQYDIYIAKIKGKQNRLYSTLKNKNPQILSNTEISLDFQNKAILDEFVSRIKPGLLSFLRDVLNNSFLELRENLAELEHVEKPTLVSDNERLKSMAEKNPSLMKLKNKFNLDFD